MGADQFRDAYRATATTKMPREPSGNAKKAVSSATRMWQLEASSTATDYCAVQRGNNRNAAKLEIAENAVPAA